MHARATRLTHAIITDMTSGRTLTITLYITHSTNTTVDRSPYINPTITILDILDMSIELDIDSTHAWNYDYYAYS